MENIGLGLQLMVVGMLTVFAILLIVINGSKLLIAIVNQIVPEKAVTPKKQMAAQQNAAILNTNTTIDAQTMEVLQQALAQITQGKGRITNVTKL
ncbi:MAG: OadG family protein [Bacteroidales bacterium]|nr:OadG family protein [Bacteroidales bacterium]